MMPTIIDLFRSYLVSLVSLKGCFGDKSKTILEIISYFILVSLGLGRFILPCLLQLDMTND